MQDSASDLQSLTARVESLEKQYHSLKSEIVTEKLILVDSDGKTRGILFMRDGGPVFGLCDADGTPRVHLSVSAEGPSLRLRDAKTKHGLELMINENGPVVSLFGADGKGRLMLDVIESEPGLSLMDANGMPSVVVRTVGGPSIGLFDPTNADGTTSVRLQVDSNVPTGHNAEAEGPSVRCVKDGKVLWSAP